MRPQVSSAPGRPDQHLGKELFCPVNIYVYTDPLRSLIRYTMMPLLQCSSTRN